MTYAISSIVSSQIAPAGCEGYTYALDASYPYVRGPWFMFSEQLIDNTTLNGGTNPAFPFLTGHGGSLQVNAYGFLGLRYNLGQPLQIDPSLPPQIQHLAHGTIHYQGWPIRAFSNRTHTTLHRLSTPTAHANMTFLNTSISIQIGPSPDTNPQTPNTNTKTKTITLHIPPNGTLTIPNRDPALTKSIPGDLAQCLPVSTSDGFLPGQFPSAALDGAESTSWQPDYAHIPQSLTVNTTSQPFQRVSKLYFNWAANPPVNATVVFHNASSIRDSRHPTYVHVPGVQVSRPYNVSQLEEDVGLYFSNETTFLLREEVWSGRFVTLVVQGKQSDLRRNATGATVAAFAVVGMGA